VLWSREVSLPARRSLGSPNADRFRNARQNVAMSRRGWWAIVGLICVVAAAHAALVAGHYVIGSFDDDGHYLALAKAFVHGKGYVDTSAPGAPTEALYPPGYPLFIAPFVALSSTVLWPLRLLSALAFVGCIPLLDVLLRRHGFSRRVCVGAMLLFALNPTAGTFATEVMPESVFLLVFLVVLVALPRWEKNDRLLSWAGVGVALGAPYLLLLKTAGLPMLAGVVGWLALRRRWRHVATLLATSALMIGPVILLRMLAGPVVGDRYTSEYQISGSLLPAIWHGVVHYFNDAIPDTLVPIRGANLLGHSVILDAALKVLRYTTTPLVMLGWWSWLRRRVDVSVLIVPFYLIETMPFPFINQRRVILLLPWVVAWYAIGWRDVLRLVARWRPVTSRAWAPTAVTAVPAVAVVALLAWQLPRDYLLQLGERTPAARGSGYVAALHELTPPGWSIETGYRWTIADLTGRTATNAAHFTFNCPDPDAPGDLEALRELLTREHVATVLDAALKWPATMDQACVFQTMSQAPWAIPVYTGRDESTVFMLLGTGSPRADLSVAANVPAPAAAETTLTKPTPVQEVSVELTGLSPNASLELHTNGHWQTVPTTITSGITHLLHAQLAEPMTASAVRVVGNDGATLQHLVVLAAPR
jgi:hypothetical protein